eukprot:730217-Pleurochrysis_carterae.AAC.1
MLVATARRQQSVSQSKPRPGRAAWHAKTNSMPTSRVAEHRRTSAATRIRGHQTFCGRQLG